MILESNTAQVESWTELVNNGPTETLDTLQSRTLIVAFRRCITASSKYIFLKNINLAVKSIGCRHFIVGQNAKNMEDNISHFLQQPSFDRLIFDGSQPSPSHCYDTCSTLFFDSTSQVGTFNMSIYERT